MNRPADRWTARAKTIGRATGLLGLVACLVSCAAGPGSGPPGTSRLASPRPTMAWIDAPPADCAVGTSGPTLNPRNAIRYARAAAIEALASGSLEVEVQSVTGTGRHGDFELTTQSLSGTLADARVVALWSEVHPDRRGRARVRQVHALACWPGADTSGLDPPPHPRWLVEPPSEAGRVCAIGLAGPTWKPEDQPVSVLRDGRLALAIALESRIDKRIFDDGRGVARVARRIEPSSAALARAAGVDALEETWLDRDGLGPIGLPGVLYGLVCLED